MGQFDMRCNFLPTSKMNVQQSTLWAKTINLVMMIKVNMFSFLSQYFLKEI